MKQSDRSGQFAVSSWQLAMHTANCKLQTFLLVVFPNNFLLRSLRRKIRELAITSACKATIGIAHQVTFGVVE